MARFLGIFLKMVWGFSRRTLRNARGEINDTYRIEFVTDHLKELQRAIEAGAPASVIICGHLSIVGAG